VFCVQPLGLAQARSPGDSYGTPARATLLAGERRDDRVCACSVRQRTKAVESNSSFSLPTEWFATGVSFERGVAVAEVAARDGGGSDPSKLLVDRAGQKNDSHALEPRCGAPGE
jgi:hypothetical protein